jgi:CheY-like chemotaxis protein
LRAARFCFVCLWCAKSQSLKSIGLIIRLAENRELYQKNLFVELFYLSKRGAKARSLHNSIPACHSTLTGDGYQVIEAVNGEEALRTVRDRLAGIALVLTEVVMPIMGGRELVTRLRAIRPDIKVVFTSGCASDPETAQHARDLGAGFIQKPFVPSTLRRTVREALDAPLQTA